MIEGHATDWNWIGVTCPASAYDAEGPYDGRGAMVGVILDCWLDW